MHGLTRGAKSQLFRVNLSNFGSATFSGVYAIQIALSIFILLLLLLLAVPSLSGVIANKLVEAIERLLQPPVSDHPTQTGHRQ